MFLLLRAEKLPPQIFADPYNDVTQFTPEPADPSMRSNFTDYRHNLAYSFANPYPDASAYGRGLPVQREVKP